MTQYCVYNGALVCSFSTPDLYPPAEVKLCERCLMAKAVVEIKRLRVTGIQP